MTGRRADASALHSRQHVVEQVVAVVVRDPMPWLSSTIPGRSPAAASTAPRAASSRS